MRLIWVLMFALLVCGCSSLGYNSLEDELSRRQEKERSAQMLKKHFESGEKYYKEGQLELAEIEFNAMLDVDPDEENALYRLGTLSFKQGKFEASAGYFERAIKSNPRNAKAHYNLASIRLMQAENHFKYYAALAAKDQDLEHLSTLLGDIDEFNSRGKRAGDSTGSLDKIAGALKK